MQERRKHKRDDLLDVVNYSPFPEGSHTVLRGWIKDWSQSGICLMVLQPLEDDQEIMVDSIVVPSSQKAVVRWQQKAGNISYKIGLEFKRR
jgi:hypothetical protein